MLNRLNTISLGIVTLLMLLTSSVFAQTGVKMGVVASGFLPSHEDYRPFLGYEVGWIQYGVSYPGIGGQFGIFHTKKLSSRIDMQAELYYTYKGYQFNHVPMYNTTVKVHLHYLELPLLCRIKFRISNKIAAGILTGPFLAYRIHAKRSISIWNETDSDALDTVKPFDYGWILGLSWQFKVNEKPVQCEFRFGWGWANILNPVEYSTSLYSDPGRTQILSGAVLIAIPFKE
jgi:hypothetical protein